MEIVHPEPNGHGSGELEITGGWIYEYLYVSIYQMSIFVIITVRSIYSALWRVPVAPGVKVIAW